MGEPNGIGFPLRYDVIPAEFPVQIAVLDAGHKRAVDKREGLRMGLLEMIGLCTYINWSERKGVSARRHVSFHYHNPTTSV